MGRWRPIFNIPLDHVHICVMHALNRIIEKMVHMHFMHVWTIKDKALQRIAINDMQTVLSLTRAHGRNVIIFKDQDLSGKSNDVPCKPSFSGVHALKLFRDNPTDTNPIRHKLYVSVVNVEHNFLRKGEAKQDKLCLWELLEALLPYFSGSNLCEDQSAEDFEEKIDAFGMQYIKCLGKCHVTHYIVCKSTSLSTIRI